MKTLLIPVKREFLNKQYCREEARRIIDESLITGMTELQIARELYFHALAYYFCEKTGRMERIRSHAHPIDLCDGGDTKARRIVFAAFWMLPIKHGQSKHAGRNRKSANSTEQIEDN